MAARPKTTRRTTARRTADAPRGKKKPLLLGGDAACVPPAGYALVPTDTDGAVFYTKNGAVHKVTVPDPPPEDDPYLRLGDDKVPYWANA